MNLTYKRFAEIDLSDSFFDSLKQDYSEFSQWFVKKANDYAYAFQGDSGALDGFLYLKVEEDAVDDVEPPLPPAKRVKVGTFKINPHGTRLGERFLKKIFDHAVAKSVVEIYVTVFEKHEALVVLFNRYGFVHCSTKTTPNGVELVLVKSMNDEGNNVLDRYPLVKIGGTRSIYCLFTQSGTHAFCPTQFFKTKILLLCKTFRILTVFIKCIWLRCVEWRC